MAESSISTVGTSKTMEKIKENCTAIDGLRHSQTYTAHFLHLSFLAASGHPDISKEIRLTAHSAQVQHSLALDCMMKFSANSQHVVDTLLPMILEGIDYKIPELITAALDEIQKIADQMYSEADRTVKRYEEIQSQVQDCLANIETKKVELTVKRAADKRAAETLVKDAENKIDTQVAAVGKYSDEYVRLCKEKEPYFEEHSKALANERINDGSSDRFTNNLFPTMAVSGVVAAGVVGVFCPPMALAAVPVATAGLAAVGVGANVLNENRKTTKTHSETDSVVAKMNKAEAKIQSALETQRKEEMLLLKYKKDQLDAVDKVMELASAEDNTADVTGLINANKGLGQVYAQLLRIKEFWGETLVCIEHFNKDARAASLYQARYDTLTVKVHQSELNWKTFINVCEKYVSVCKHDDSESIRRLYTFLSEPIDSMTMAQRKERQANIAEQIRSRIQELGNA